MPARWWPRPRAGPRGAVAPAPSDTLRHIDAEVRRLLPALAVHRALVAGERRPLAAAGFLRGAFPEAEIWGLERRAASRRDRNAGRDVRGTHWHRVVLGAPPLPGVDAGVRRAPSERTPPELTGDAFCAAHGLDSIDYLQVAVDRDELDMLRGFQGMLGELRIALVDVTAGMTWDRKGAVPFERLKAYLEPLGYPVLRIFEQASELDGRPHLQRCRVVFVSQKAIDANTGRAGARG